MTELCEVEICYVKWRKVELWGVELRVELCDVKWQCVELCKFNLCAVELCHVIM